MRVGDKIRIREWDDMENEYGLNFMGDIDVYHSFTVEMRYLCGTEHVVTDIEDSHTVRIDGWIISDDMVKIINNEEPVTKDDYDPVSKPSHYCKGGNMECIDEMELVFGPKYVMAFCLLNAWKYRRRAMYKNGQQDMDKAAWYLDKYKELKEKTDA